MSGFADEKEAKRPHNVLNTLLFFANWLFVVFLSKSFISPPHGDLDFLVKNIGTFFVATVMTGLMIHFSSRKGTILLISVMVVLALVVALC